jgi:hypothetical protein
MRRDSVALECAGIHITHLILAGSDVAATFMKSRVRPIILYGVPLPLARDPFRVDDATVATPGRRRRV